MRSVTAGAGVDRCSDMAIDEVLEAVLQWSKTRGFRGFNKHDGLNSPFLRFALGWSKWSRLVAIQLVMRAPINVRPLLGVSRTYNPKGLALFTQGLLARFRITNDARYLDDARELLALLSTLRSPGRWAGSCWGYPYPWQD